VNAIIIIDGKEKRSSLPVEKWSDN
jgi:hypothetical protein